MDIKYLDLVQTDPKEFNKLQAEKQEQYKKEHGVEAYQQIMWGRKHHELKARKTTDYRLTPEELEKLKKDKVLFRLGERSFAQIYEALYNNDMPVFVTSDSILYAFHRFYDEWLMEVETTKFTDQLTSLLTNLLESLYQIQVTDQNRELLRDLEVYLKVAHTLLNLRNELTPCGLSTESTYSSIVPMTKEQMCEEMLNYQRPQISWRQERDQGYDPTWMDHNLSRKKYKQFLEYIGIDPAILKRKEVEDDTEGDELIRDSICDALDGPKYTSIIASFKISNIKEPIVLRYGGDELFHTLISLIGGQQDVVFNMNGVELKMNGTQFKPRGHYTKSLELKNYFMGFNWLFSFAVPLIKKEYTREEKVRACQLASTVAWISRSCLAEIQQFQRFIEQIIGTPDGLVIGTLLPMLTKIVPEEASVNWFLENGDELLDRLTPLLETDAKKCTLTSFGQINEDFTEYSFSLIGRGTSVDNTVIQQLVDHNLKADDGSVPKRKFPRVFDLVYTLFENDGVIKVLEEEMSKLGYSYRNQLGQLREMCRNQSLDNTIYNQELIMLRTLSKDRTKISPFDSTSWLAKQAHTQIAHYAELRHDNVLYLQEVFGFCNACEYPAILVEPVPTFWREFLTLIDMMEKLSGENELLTNFRKVVNNCITFVDQYLESGQVDPELEEDMKSIAKEVHLGSGEPDYKGWYFKLFKEPKDGLKQDPEVGSMFTGVPDLRGDGGILHIGTGKPQLMYVLVGDQKDGSERIMMGPVYSAYEQLTKYDERFNDEEWGKQVDKYKPVNLLE